GITMGLSQVVVLLIGGYASDWIRNRPLIMKIGALLSTLSAGIFAFAMATPALPSATLLLIAACGGVAVFSGGAIFSFLADRYPEDVAPASIGYAEVFGVFATFVAPAMMGVIIDQTDSFFNAFVAFAAVEAAVLLLLIVLSIGQGRAEARR
ncbi:hypothetical protein MXD81_10915, partial [Microbacteriaceae bacterium K1510]|nr:hypothetical protein [Microbacteriaceae bacterium K1510]